MRTKKENSIHETETAFAVAMLLMNALILIVIGVTAYLVHSTLAENAAFSAFLRGGFLQ